MKIEKDIREAVEEAVNEVIKLIENKFNDKESVASINSVNQSLDSDEQTPSTEPHDKRIKPASIISNESIKKDVKKRVGFKEVEVFEFERTQGFLSIPSERLENQITLGMSLQHIDSKKFTSLDDYLMQKRELHLKHLEKKCKEISVLNISGNIEDELETSDDGSQDREQIMYILENRNKYQNIDTDLPISSDIFCPVLDSDERRQKLLECSGLTSDDFDSEESRDIIDIYNSRDVCGCSCKEKGAACNRDTCSCYANGIGCQQEKFKFPCSCTLKWCKNPNGMKRFDTKGVSNHLKKVLIAGNSYGEDFDKVKKDVCDEVNIKKRKSSPRRKFTNKRKKKATILIVTPNTDQDQVQFSSISKSLRSNSKKAALIKIEKTQSELVSKSPLPPPPPKLEEQQTLSPTSSQSSSSSTFSQELAQKPLSVNLINQL